MGIYDRDYYRNEGPSYLDRLIPSGAVCKWLIGINIVAFLLQLATSRSGFDDYLVLRTDDVLHGQVWRLLTYAFLHVDPIHIFFNMLFLWWFGSALEEWYGAREFLGFYLVAAVVGGLGYCLHGAFDRATYAIPCIGASGAITALLLLYAFHFPRATILVMLVVPVPIWFFVVFMILRDVAGLFGHSQIAVSVHLAGAAFGALYFKLGWRVTSFLSFWQTFQAWRKNRSRPRLRIYQPEEEKVAVAAGARTGPELDEHMEAKLDTVLEKVQRSGQSSLTEQERQILLKASEFYKRKRT